MAVRFSETYARAMKAAGGVCPIEAGLIGYLADHECTHGRLPEDPTPACGCWPSEKPATPDVLAALPKGKRRRKAPAVPATEKEAA